MKRAKRTAFAFFLWKKVPEGRMIAELKARDFKRAQPTALTPFLWKGEGPKGGGWPS